MKNFQLLPCNDKLIFTHSYGGGDVYVKKRMGILIESVGDIEKKHNDDGFDYYRQLFIDEFGSVCDYGYDDSASEAYCPVCHEGEVFVPKNFAEHISEVMRFWGLMDILNGIVKRGGVKKCPEETTTIKVFVDGGCFRFDTLDDFYSFGSLTYVNNPFIEKQENKDYSRVLDIAKALQHYRDFFDRPDLRVETTFLSFLQDKAPDWMEREVYESEIAEEKRREAEWKPVLDLMINKNLTLEQAKAELA